MLVIKTGDGKKIKVDSEIRKISEFLNDEFEKNNEIYFENATTDSIKRIISYTKKILKLTNKQLTLIKSPNKFLNGKKADEELISFYNNYKKLSHKERFELFKTASDMKIEILVIILSHIIATMIEGKSVEELKTEFQKTEN